MGGAGTDVSDGFIIKGIRAGGYGGGYRVDGGHRLMQFSGGDDWVLKGQIRGAVVAP